MENENKPENIIARPPEQPIQPVAWYAQKKYLAIIILTMVAGGVVAAYFILNQPKNSAYIATNTQADLKNWKTYSDNDSGFSVKYPPSLYFVPSSDHYSAASSTGEFSIQNVPSPELFHYYIDPKTNKSKYDFKPYHRGGFTIEFRPETHSDDWSVQNFTNNIAPQYDCNIENIATTTVAGVESYKYNLKGDNTGESIVAMSYVLGKGLQVHFQSSYDPNSVEQKNALQMFNQVLSTLTFTATSSTADFDKIQSGAIAQITWQKYPNPFIEFEYPSNYGLGTDKSITDHKINATTKKDMYGFVGMILGTKYLNNTVIDTGSIDITAFPNTMHLGDEQFDQYRQDFEKNKSKSGDSFSMITVDGLKASFQHLDTYDSFDIATCNESFRIGTDKVNFFTKDYSYEITMDWTRERNNSTDSVIQQEFQRFLSSFHILNK